MHAGQIIGKANSSGHKFGGMIESRTCHCRGAACRSRRNAADPNRLAIKTYQPIASVAALSERLVYGHSTALGRWCTSRSPELSLRGGRRPTWQSRRSLPNCRKAIGENVTAFPRLPRPFWGLAMTNLEALHIRRECLHICNCPWRSLSAATDAIGAYHFNGGLCESPVPSRDCHGRKAPSQ